MRPADVSPEATKSYLETAIRLARAGGQLIAAAFAGPVAAYDRKSLTDPVTETDRQVEDYIFGQLRKEYPEHLTIGEESASDNEHTDAPTWIVDPIDGTANFVHRQPQVCVSIGLTIGRMPVVGVVYNPILDELYEATHDGPAMLNGKRISVSGVTELTSACVLAEFGSDRMPAKIEVMVSNLKNLLLNNVQCVRTNGSCALNMCYIACGRIDVYSEYGPYSWDMAAGSLIVLRAGGSLTGAGGEPFVLTGRSVLACTPGLKEKVLELHTPVVT